MNVNPFARDGSFSLRDLQSELDRLVDRFWHAGLSTRPLDGQDWAPPLDATEEPGAYRIRVELPGVTADQVEVNVLGRTLTIRGQKPNPRGAGDARQTLRAECRYGAFRRDLELPGPVDADRIAAIHRNGILEIEAPKTPATQPHSVRVEARSE